MCGGGRFEGAFLVAIATMVDVPVSVDINIFHVRKKMISSDFVGSHASCSVQPLPFKWIRQINVVIAEA